MRALKTLQVRRRPKAGAALSGVVVLGGLTFAVFSMAAKASAQAPAPQRPVTAQHAALYRPPIGQTLTYSVDWRLFPAGQATFRVENAGQEYRVVANADAVGAVSVLYHVHDSFESFIDAKTLCSRAISKHTEEGFRRLDTNITFDLGRKKSILNEHNLKNGERKTQENDIPGCVADAVSSLFYIASLPLTAGSSYEFPLNDGGATANVHVSVEAREQIKTPAGAFSTVRVEAAGTGTQKAKGAVQIWFTDDAEHLPVQIKARMFWGTLTFHLLPQAAK